MTPITHTLAPAGFLQYAVAGIYVFILEANGALICKTDAGEVTELRTGLTWYPKREFQWIRFENETGADVTVKFAAGLDRLVDASSTQLTSPWIVEERANTSAVLNVATAGTGATTLTGAPASNRDVLLVNTGSQTVFVGPATVTIGTGIPLPAGESLTLPRCNWQVYGIVASGTSEVRALIERA